MSFDAGFDDVLDMSSYAADETTGLDDNAFVDHSMAQFPAHSSVEPSFPHVRSASARTPSPFATYPGAVAPFTAPGTFYRHASPLPPNLGDPAVASSSLSVTADLIHQGRAHAGGAQAHWNGYFAPSASTSSSSAGPAQVAAVQPGALFSPPLSTGSSTPTMTITPSVISAQPTPRSASASRESTPRAAPAPAKKASSSSSSSKVARSASPAVTTSKRTAPSTYSPEHWTSFLPKIRTYTDSKRLQRSPIAAAQFLVRNLHGLFTYADRSSTASPWGDASDVPPEGRAEVLSAIASYAKDDFWRAWVDEGSGSASATTTSAGKGKEKEKDKDKGGVAAESGKSDGLELLQCWLEGASQRIVMSTKDKEEASALKGGAAKERKAKELEHATLVLILQVRLFFLSLSPSSLPFASFADLEEHEKASAGLWWDRCELEELETASRRRGPGGLQIERRQQQTWVVGAAASPRHSSERACARERARGCGSRPLLPLPRSRAVASRGHNLRELRRAAR